MKKTLFLVGALALAGCPRPPVVSLATIRAEDLPADPAELDRRATEWEGRADAPSLENALLALDKAIALAPTFERAIQAARIAGLLADEAGAKPRRAKFAGAGEGYAERAIALDGKRVEGHYFRAVHLGFDASTRTIGALERIPEMVKEARAAVAIDEQFDHAGPHRLLGALFLRAPSWPASVGDVDEALHELRRAVELDAAHPANHLFYGEALATDGKHQEARAELERVLAAAPDPAWSIALPRWRAEAAEELKKLPTGR